LPLGLSRRLLAQCSSTFFACLMAFCVAVLLGGSPLNAQSTSGGGIQGTITDPSGASVAKAKITVTNTDTGIQTTRLSSSTGTYTIGPLQVGTYNVEVVAKGFQRVLQENINVDNSSMFGLNIKLTLGGESTTITVTDAPAPLDTTDATLGGTIENELYSNLPLSMNGGPRDPTAFQYLMPGVQENPANNGADSTGAAASGETNGNSGIYGGSGATNLNENYVNGVPVSNIAQQGSSVPVANAVSVDSVDQFSVQTSGASTSFGGAGVTNYTIKSGGNQYHGGVFDYIRNTMFDTWGYFSKVPAANGFAEKPGEHQNSYGGSLSGPIIKDKLFFFGNYEGFAYTKISNTPQYLTLPTMAERTGNFTDQLGSTVSNIADARSGARSPYQGVLNGVPTYNVMNPSQISSISTYLQSALPTPNSLAIFNNYLASLPLENRDYSVNVNLNYTMNSRNSFTITAIGGNRGFGGQPLYNNYNQIPIPYAAGSYINQKTASGILSYTYIASQTLINSIKYGYTRNWGESFSLTQGKTSSLMPATTNSACNPAFPTANENSCAAGINNLPQGGATDNMPSVSFAAGNGPQAPNGWSSNSSSGPTATNAYTFIDNLQWMKNRHNVTFGLQVQWLETNGGSFGGYSQSLALHYDGYDTEVSTAQSGYNGDAYASYLSGAVYSSTVSAQTIVDVGGRYRPIAPYIQDNWQVSPKLTLNLGLRYDYLQPYHEVKNRISYLDTAVTNPIVGIPGVLEYAGTPNINNFAPSLVPPESSQQEYDAYAPYYSHATTPVKPYNKNFEPRLGLSFAYNPTTVFSGGFGMQLTHAGGAGGGAGATAGTGNNSEYGISSGVSQAGSTGPPAYFLNPGIQGQPNNAVYDPPVQGTQPELATGLGPNIPCVAAGTCSAFSAVPPWLVPGANANPLGSTGNYNFVSYFSPVSVGGNGASPTNQQNNYLCATADQQSCLPGNVNYADPYYGGRGPVFVNYNFSVQKMINRKAVFTAAYSGSQTHFLPGGTSRGYARNGISPDNSILFSTYLQSSAQTNLKAIQLFDPSYNLPYPDFTGTSATVANSLKAFPQFGSMTDLWGETGNSNYNSIQLSVIQRPWHNLSGFMNYTRSKEIDDLGNHRTQYPLGPENGNFTHYMPANEVDRGLGSANQTNAINVTWVYGVPIGRGQKFGSTNRLLSAIGGGWQISGIYKYRDGYPIQVTNGRGCAAATNGLQGTCMPDYTPGFNKKNARINGRWGRGSGTNATSLGQISYLNPEAFQCPDSNPNNITTTCGTSGINATWKIGNVARSAPDGLTGPGWWDIDMGIRRTFMVRETPTLHLSFEFEADVSNATNSTFFNLASPSWNPPSNSVTGVTLTSYGTMGGQNQSVSPRDWQFDGRFRF
jgi:hypothetical protein